MVLTFTNTVEVGEGSFPCAIHDSDNHLRVTYLNEDGEICCYSADPPYGQYGSLTFTDKGRCSPDSGITKPCLKRVAHYGAYGFWSADGTTSSVKDHKFVVYMMPTDISKTLIDGSVSASVDSDVASLSLSLLNVRGELLNRSRSLTTPGTEIDVYFSLGSSDECPLGVFYVDRSDVGYPEEKVSVSARNAMGKLLKEQTFDENYEIDEGTFQDNLKKILQLAGISSYFVADPSGDKVLTFEPDTGLLEGIQSAISTLTSWKVGENTDGTVGIAPKSDSRWEPTGIYTFVRDHTCWSYHVTYDDTDAAARVCVTSKAEEEGGTDVSVYVNVAYNKWWTQPPHRTLHKEANAGLTQSEVTTIANSLADSLAISGRSETFTGIFTPQLILGDEVKVTDENEYTESVGTVTSVKHNFGKSGFHTEFTVDSGGRHGKGRLKDLISEITGASSAYTTKQEEAQDGDEVEY